MKKERIQKLVSAAFVAVVLGTTAVITVSSAGNGGKQETVDVTAQVDAGEYLSVQAPLQAGTMTTGMNTGSQGESNPSTTSNRTESVWEPSDDGAAWVPVTEADKKFFSYVGKEAPAFKAAGSAVDIRNSVQGVKCHEVFDSVRGDFSIARTYNIFVGKSNVKNPVYSTDSFTSVQLQIPSSLVKNGRTFEMICVSEKGVPYIFQDEDSDPGTITFTTNRYFAYALCYKD